MERILLPLDGSRLSERSIPFALELARKSKAEIVLLHVLEENAPKDIHGERHLRTENEAKEYLGEIASTMFPPDTLTRVHVHEESVKDPAVGLALHEEEYHADLLLMAAHGYDLPGRLMRGTMAQRIIEHGRVPVLALHVETDDRPPKLDWTSILVPLDQNPAHEAVMGPVMELAKLFHSRIDLLRVVETPVRFSGTQTSASVYSPALAAELRRQEALAAQEALIHRQRELQTKGFDARWEVRTGNPAKEIVAFAKQDGGNLIALGTHGKAGLEAFWNGSVANAVITRLRANILLVPVAAEPGAGSATSGNSE